MRETIPSVGSGMEKGVNLEVGEYSTGNQLGKRIEKNKGRTRGTGGENNSRYVGGV